jgi:hypothetical protein
MIKDSKNSNYGKVTDIRKYRKEMTIGTIIAVFVLICIGGNYLFYRNKPRLSTYQVVADTMHRDDSTTGLIFRQERDIASADAGYVRYYNGNGSRVKVGESVYSISATSDLVLDSIAENNGSFDADSLTKLSKILTRYQKSYSSDDFSNVYDFKSDFESEIYTLTQNMMLEDASLKADASSDTDTYTTDASGIVSYYTDSLDGTDISSFNTSMFNTEYAENSVRTSEQLLAGAVVYKLITSDEWYIVVPLSDDEISKYVKTSDDGSNTDAASLSSVTFYIDGSDKAYSGTYSILNSGSDCYMVITMNSYLTDYLDTRTVTVSFKSADDKCLKIPVSALTTKKYYMIPVFCFVNYDESTGKVIVPQATTVSNESLPAPATTVSLQEETTLAVQTTSVSDSESATDQIQTQQTSDSTAASGSVSDTSQDTQDESEDEDSSDETVSVSGKYIAVITYDSKTGDEIKNYVKPDVLYNDNDYAYVACDDDGNMTIENPENSLDIIPSTTLLEGAFNVNKGYAIFKRIERISSDENYITIKENTPGGLKIYDHIGLVSGLFSEDEAIY